MPSAPYIIFNDYIIYNDEKSTKCPPNDLTNISEVKAFLNSRAYASQIILRLGPQINLSDLQYCAIDFLRCTKLREVIFLLSGVHYVEAENREQVLQALTDLASKYHWRFFSHVFLLTRPSEEFWVTDLETDSVEQSGFCALKQDRGYYLSDPQLFSRIYRNLQNDSQRVGLELAEIFNDAQRVPTQKQSTYIIQNGLPTEQYRKSKRFDAQQLKAQLSFTVTQQYAQTRKVTQNQTLQQQQDLSQQQELSQTQAHQQQRQQQMGIDIFRSTISFAAFEQRLYDLARVHHVLPDADTKLMRDSHHYTEYHAKTNLMSRLLIEPDFRSKVTATIFRRFPYNPCTSGLGMHSFVQMDARIAEHLLGKIEQIVDGLDGDSLVLEEGFYSLIMSPLYCFSTLIGYSGVFHHSTPAHISHLSMLSAAGPHQFQPVIQAAALLREEDWGQPRFHNTVRQTLKDLLTVFDPSCPTTLNDEPRFRRYLWVLFCLHCPTADVSIFTKFLESFPTLTRDHCKIILYPIVTGYRHHAEQFLLLLTALEQRALLENFRRIYFDYALTVDVVADLLQQKRGRLQTIYEKIQDSSSHIHIGSWGWGDSPDLFLTVAQRTPIGLDSADWPPFETFAHHFLLYTSKQAIDIQQIDLKILQKFWHRVDAKMYRYYKGDREAADHGMQLFVDKVICPQRGLVIAPVCQVMTILDGFENMIANAIRLDTLTEQLREWEDVSLLVSDAVYAGCKNDFGVVTKEMAIEIRQLRLTCEKGDTYHLADCYKSSYQFSAQDLKTLLNEQCLVDTGVYDTFRIKIFRYLGCQTLREPIDFYRQLHQFKNQQTDTTYVYFRHMLWGYFILTKTGAHYTQHIDSKTLYQDFVNYLLRKDYIPPNNDYLPEVTQARIKQDPTQIMHTKINGEFHEIILICVQDFYLGLQAIKLEKAEKNHYSLWGFYNKYRPEESSLKQGLSWFGLSLVPSFETIPAVFKKKFSMQSLAKFFLVHQDELKKSAHIFNHSPNILIGLVVAKIKETFAATAYNRNYTIDQQILRPKKEFLFYWLEHFLPQMSIDQFIHNLVDLETLVTDFSEWALEEDYDLLSEPVRGLLGQHRNLKTGLQILHLIAQQRNSEHYQSKLMQTFLESLPHVSDLLASQTHFQELLPVLCTAYMTSAKPEWLMRLLCLSQQLVHVEALEAAKTLKTLLLHCPWQQEAPPFFLVNSLSAQQLQGLAAVLADKSVDLSLLSAIWRDYPQTDFSDFYALLRPYDLEQSAALSQLALHIYEPNSAVTMVQILTLCNTHPQSALLLLARLTSLYQIDADRIRTILHSPNLKQEMQRLEQDLYGENLQRFAYEPQDVAKKIAKIRKKSMREEVNDEPLASEEQAKLLADYQIMMSYMLKNPVFIAKNGQGEDQPLTIHQLDEEQCKTVYQLFSAKLRDATLSAEKKHAYRLALLALSCETHYRTTKKFPQNTQILCELHGLDDPDSTIQEVKTGGGKSIISELRAVILCAEGWSVDIATENIALAETALRKFKLFYEYLGVPTAKDVILPNTPRSAYIEGGIHHSTPANFSFFRANMALKKKTLPTRVALLCDEIDAVLTTTIQYRLAGVLDPIYSDLKSWSVVLTELLAFVSDEEIFLHNNCDELDDVHNFKTYFCRKNADKKLTQFVEKIPQETLNMLLNSARMPEALQASVDYLSIVRQHLKKMEQYAAPILNVGTKRPEPSVSYSEGVQQLLHTMLSAQLAKGAHAYSLEAITETLMIISAKNFFDSYPLVIGWTGTPGSKIELHEFSQENGLQAYYYPVFHSDLSENIGTVIAETRVEQDATVLERIREERVKKPGQPILLVADSPKAVVELQQYIQASAADLVLQSYTGYEDAARSEQDIVERAGQDNIVTITTLSLTRGTDFESFYAQGICEINTAADITESDAIQLEGRVARNGKPGQYSHIICAEDLDPATADIAASAERFKAHQRIIGLKRQQERLKTRFLEVMRYHVVTNYFLAVRQAADRILADQQGIYATLIAEKTFLEALRDFNKQSEKLYTQLLGTQAVLTSEQKETFMRQLVGLYQTALDRLIADQDLQNFQAIEPLIAVDPLQTAPLPGQLKVRDLSAVSDVLSSGWRVAGNQLMVQCWTVSEDVLSEFQPYFDGDCSLRVATAQTLERREILKIPKVVAEIDHIKEMIQEFEWNGAVENVQRGIVDSSDDGVVKAVGAMIGQIFSTDIIQQCKDFVLNYLEETKTQIAQKRWDDLALPNFNIPWIQTWLRRISLIFSTFAWITWGSAFVAGPIPFILTRFVLPTVLSWIKTMVKRWFADSESTMVQVLVGLDDAFADLAKFVDVLLKKDLKTMTIDELLQDIAPVFKNKAIQ